VRKISAIIAIFIIIITCAIFIFQKLQKISGAPPYGEAENEIPDLNPYTWIKDWKRPEGPAKVALQVGHWNSKDVPDELQNLRDNTGSSGGGKWEWEVNLAIAQETKKFLEEKGIQVEILPATVPPSYWADVFLAIHADGSTDKSKSGYKIASPWRDYTQKSDELVTYLENSYERNVGFTQDPNITRNMRGYYAFSWWKYEHSIHPMTTAAIIETGFLTNYKDQKILINSPEIPAKAIADGTMEFLKSENLVQ